MRHSGRFVCLLFFGLSLGLNAQTQPSTTEQAGVDVLEPSLVALGTLGASNAYYSYLVIGSAADSFVNGGYEASLASGIVNEVIYLNTGSIASLQDMIIANGLSKEDKAALVNLVETYQLLVKQARALIKFINDRNEQGMEYQEYREKAWQKIRVLFGK